jgi:TPR repeat protein
MKASNTGSAFTSRSRSDLAKDNPGRCAPAAARQGAGAAPPQALPRQSEVNAAGIAVMMKNGADRMENGDIAGARLMFQRAAQTGDAGAAFALAETYDPLVLRELGRRITIMSDIALAQSWYKKARDLGSTLAPERIARLTQLVE